MTTRSARCSAAMSLLVALAACGTTVETERGSGGSGGTGGVGGASSSSGATASSSSASGGCDAPPPEACPTTAQCVSPTLDCSCLGSPGAWNCAPSNAGTLPSVTPVEGSCCEEEGMFCGGFEPCGPICHCTGGAWSCKPLVDCPPFACPSPVQTLAGEACPALVGEVCEGTGTCHYTCICKLDPATGSAAWQCTIPPC